MVYAAEKVHISAGFSANICEYCAETQTGSCDYHYTFYIVFIYCYILLYCFICPILFSFRLPVCNARPIDTVKPL